eukprot:6177682-Pleurochrysis_carterae.AAC.4
MQHRKRAGMASAFARPCRGFGNSTVRGATSAGVHRAARLSSACTHAERHSAGRAVDCLRQRAQRLAEVKGQRTCSIPEYKGSGLLKRWAGGTSEKLDFEEGPRVGKSGRVLVTDA